MQLAIFKAVFLSSPKKYCVPHRVGRQRFFRDFTLPLCVFFCSPKPFPKALDHGSVSAQPQVSRNDGTEYTQKRTAHTDQRATMQGKPWKANRTERRQLKAVTNTKDGKKGRFDMERPGFVSSLECHHFASPLSLSSNRDASLRGFPCRTSSPNAQKGIVVRRRKVEAHSIR